MALDRPDQGNVMGMCHQFIKPCRGRHIRCPALTGLVLLLSIEPRALPWAGLFRPVGATTDKQGAGIAAKVELALPRRPNFHPNERRDV